MRDLTLSHLTIGAPPLETIQAAASAGFRAVCIRLSGRRFQDPYPVQVIGSPLAIREIRTRLDDLGVRLASVNAFQFYQDVTWERLAPVVDTAAALEAPIIIANGFDEESRFVDLFGRFCDAAKPAGVRIALEFLPYSQVRTLGDAMRIIDQCDCANASVLIDALHLYRSGGSAADVRQVDPARIAFAQLCDAMQPGGPLTDAELMHQARTSRLELGQGALPLHDFVDALPDGLELEYEVIRADLAERSAEEKARAARKDVDRFIASYGRHRARHVGTH